MVLINSKLSILRFTLQILFNFTFYTLLLKHNLDSLQDLSFYFKLPSILIIIVLFHILSSILLNSIILGFINTILILNVSLSKLLFINRMEVFILFIILIFSTIIVFKIFSINDIVLNTIRDKRLVIKKTFNYITVIRNYTLFFASLSLTLPLITLLYTYILLDLLNIDYSVVYRSILFYLYVNIAISLITLFFINNYTSVFKTSLLSTASIWSLIPLLACSITIINEIDSTKSIEFLKPRNPDKGILLGSVKAVLKYGTPRRLYNGFDQEWIRNVKRKTWFWLEHNDLLLIDPGKIPNRHIVIMGSSGSGKSLLAKNIILELYVKHGVKFIVFDPHNEYYIIKKYINDIEIVDASTLSLNPLEIGRSNPRERAHQLSNAIMSIFKLGHLQRQTIEELILKTYEYFGIFPDSPSSWSNKPPTLRDVLETCRKTLSEPELREVYSRVYPYLKVLADNVFAGTSLSFSRVFDKPSIIVLSNLKSDYIKLLYVDTFLHRLMNMMYRRELKGEYMIVLDEAYTLFTRDYSRQIMSKLLVESRKYGIGVVYITQYALATPQPVIENASIKIAFNISEPRNLDYVSKIFSGVYHSDRLNAIKSALKSIKSLNYLISISGLNDILVVSEEEFAKYLLENGLR